MSVAAGKLDQVEAEFLAINAAFADRGFIRQTQNNGRDIYVWTVNDNVGMSTMIGRGVNGLITDHPALARQVIEQRKEMTPGQRLLIELADVFGIQPKTADQ